MHTHTNAHTEAHMHLCKQTMYAETTTAAQNSISDRLWKLICFYSSEYSFCSGSNCTSDLRKGTYSFSLSLNFIESLQESRVTDYWMISRRQLMVRKNKSVKSSGWKQRTGFHYQSNTVHMELWCDVCQLQHGADRQRQPQTESLWD